MKAFFEEYGFVIVAAIVIIILIVMATPIGEVIQTSLTKFVTDWATAVGNLADKITTK